MCDDVVIPLEEWVTLQRPRALYSIDLAVEFLEKGMIEDALGVLRALAYRFDVDQSVEEFFHLRSEEGESHVHQ